MQLTWGSEKVKGRTLKPGGREILRVRAGRAVQNGNWTVAHPNTVLL